MKSFVVIVTLVAVVGCESKIQPKMEAAQVNLSKEDCLANPAYPGCAEYLGSLESDFSITQAKPMVANSGETVMIYGENFPEGMLVKVNGQDVSANVISGTEASFVMPDGLTNGKVDALAQKYDKTKPFLLYAWVDDTYPLITKEPSEVCQGEKYYNAAGEILEGAKDCGDSALACTQDGQVGCLTTETAKAALVSQFGPSDIVAGKTIAGIAGGLDLSNLSPANIAAGVMIAGITGAYPSATYPLAGDTAAADLPSLDGTVAAGSYEWFKADGTRVTGAIADAGTITPGTSNQTFNASVYRQFTVAGDADLIASNIKDTISVFGVTGNLSGTPPNCSSDGEVGCVTIPSFKAADMTNVTAGNIKAGVTIAAQAGNYPSATYPLAGNTGTTDLPSLASTVAAGSYEWFKSDGTLVSGSITDAGAIAPGATNQTFNTSVYRQFTVNGDADLVAGNIKNAIDIFGVTGNVTVESHSSCATDGEAGCVVLGPAFKAADMSQVTAGNIKSGVTIAGQAGDYPSATNPLAGNTVATDLPSLAATVAAGSYEWFKSDGSLVSGSITDAGTITPGATNQSFNTSVYRQFTVNGDADLVAGNIKNTIDIFGVTGNVVQESHSNCTGNAQQGCITTATYQSADLTNLAAGNIKSGVTIAGQAGDYPSATYPLPGADATADLVSGTFNAQVKSATAFEYWDSAGARQTGAGDADITAANIASSVNIFGTVGTATLESHSNCTGNAQQGCITTATYKSADLTNLTAGNIKSGVTIAGQAGDYPSATNPLAGNTVATDLPSLAATVAAGSYEWFKSDGTLVSGDITDAGSITPGATNQTFNTSVYRQFTVNGDADLVAGNIKNTIDIFGVTGNVVAESHSNCTGNAQQGCITTATYQSGDLTNLSAGNIKAGVTIAGQAGDYPSATYRLTGADATTDLPAFASTTGGSSYEWFQSDGSRLTGSVQADQNVTASTSDQTLNAGLYRSVTVAGDADLVAGKIKSGVTLFGVAGDYPSATNPLTNADATADLDLATFNAKIKSASSFEWFDSAGARYTNTGDADITAANIVSGVSIFGTSGSAVSGSNCTSDGEIGCVTTSQYKSADTNAYSTWDIRKGKTVGGKAGDIVFYKNMIGSYNNSTAPAVAGNDVWDTIDDYNNGGAFPTTAPGGWDQATAANWIMDPANDVGGGGGTASDNLCSGTEACVFKDQITGLMWAKDDGTTRTWQDSITYCDGLNYGGYTDWRLPTEKELQQGYIDGIWSQKATNKLNLTTSYYWSSSTLSYGTSDAWVVTLTNGDTYFSVKTDSFQVSCVRP